MKRVSFLLSILSVVFALPSMAQNAVLDLPPNTIVPHYRLTVSYNTTTVLIFHAAVKPVDRGDRDVIAQKQAEVENVLKLKAAHPHISPTNLHVFTADGRIYCFDITYTDSPAVTRNLTDLTGSDPAAPEAILTQEPINSDVMARLVQRARALPTKGIASASQSRMKVKLQAIGLADGLLFFRLKISNHSDLDYHIDFLRLYIRDHQQVKRSSVQETESVPVFEDTTTLIAGKHALTHVVAVPAFSLPVHKRFFIEIFEKNGGRSLTLQLKNKQLFRVQKL